MPASDGASKWATGLAFGGPARMRRHAGAVIASTRCLTVGRVQRVTSSEVWDEETAAHYDQEAAERYDPAVLGPTVDFLAELAGSGAALELAIGTGRVALPLAKRGVAVSGIELSEAMLA